MASEFQLKKEIVRVGQILYRLGFMPATDGNISVRLDENFILITPSGLSKGFISLEDIVKVSIDGTKKFGVRIPSSEIIMHLFIYKRRPDISAIVHAHPPFATGFAASGLELSKPVLAESVIRFGGRVPLARYAEPGTEEVSKSISEFVEKHNAILLANHGVVCYAKSLEESLYLMETVEHLAKVTFVTENIKK